MRAKIKPIELKVNTKSILNLIVCYNYENDKMPYLVMNNKTYECIKIYFGEIYTLRNIMEKLIIEKLPQENVEFMNNEINNSCLYGCKIFIDNELKFGEIEIR